jgi:ABC-type sugar transport system substrate-binding protein
MGWESSRTGAALVLVLALGGVAAGCGSDNNKKSDVGIQSAGGSKARQAATAGEQAAGSSANLKRQVVGFINSTGAAEITRRQEAGTKAAAKALGWSYKRCDAQGDPAKMTQCARTLLNQGATVMLGASVEAAPVKAQMQQADRRGIPWMNVGGAVQDNPLFDAQVIEDEAAMTKVVDDYMFKQLGTDNAKLAYTEFPPIFAFQQRTQQLTSELKQHPNVKVVSKHVVDFTNPIEDVRGWANTVLTRNRDLDAFWGVVDFDAVSISQAVAAKFPGKQPPDRPLVVGYFGDLANLAALRKGQADAVVEVPLEAVGWIALDQAAQFFARKRDISKTPLEDYQSNFLEPQLITRANAPAKPNTYVEPKVDFASFFTAKWKKEFQAGT